MILGLSSPGLTLRSSFSQVGLEASKIRAHGSEHSQCEYLTIGFWNVKSFPSDAQGTRIRECHPSLRLRLTRATEPSAATFGSTPDPSAVRQPDLQVRRHAPRPFGLTCTSPIADRPRQPAPGPGNDGRALTQPGALWPWPLGTTPNPPAEQQTFGLACTSPLAACPLRAPQQVKKRRGADPWHEAGSIVPASTALVATPWRGGRVPEFTETAEQSLWVRNPAIS